MTAEEIPDTLLVIGGPDHLTISDEDGYEVAHWTADEWEEAPQVGETIAEAVRLSQLDPQALLEKLFGDSGRWAGIRAEREEPAWKAEAALLSSRQ